MKKVRKPKTIEPDEDGMLSEYDFSNALPSHHYENYRKGVSITVYSPNKKVVEMQLSGRSNLILLEPDVARIFRNAQSVNKALRNIIDSVPTIAVRKSKAA